MFIYPESKCPHTRVVIAKKHSTWVRHTFSNGIKEGQRTDLGDSNGTIRVKCFDCGYERHLAHTDHKPDWVLVLLEKIDQPEVAPVPVPTSAPVPRPSVIPVPRPSVIPVPRPSVIPVPPPSPSMARVAPVVVVPPVEPPVRARVAPSILRDKPTSRL